MCGLDRFGGIVCYDGQRWRAERLHIYDSAPPPVGSKDRRSLHFFTETGAGNRDVTIRDCTIEDLQLDVHATRRARVTGNTLRRGVVTGALLIVSGVDGVTMEDYLIADNLIESPIGSGIGVLLDPFSTNNCTFRSITIRNNHIAMGPQTGRGVYLGTTNNAQASMGNVFQDIRVEGNTILCADAGVRDAYIFGNNSLTANIACDGWVVTGNRIRGNGTGAGVDLRRMTNTTQSPNYLTGAS
jgi:hypothetical protein